jgi:hypothetical protein
MPVEVMRVMLKQYRRAVHDLNNIIGALTLRLDVYDMVAEKDPVVQTGPAAELARDLREAVTSCRQIIDGLRSARSDEARQ